MRQLGRLFLQEHIDLRFKMPHGTKISLAAETESPGVGPPEMT
jgi:hypothetical protein